MTRALRQPPPDKGFGWGDPREGFKVVWVRDDAREALCDGGKCRRPGCKRPAVWMLLRSNGWWRYCDWHTYGRDIRPDGVYRQRLVREEPAS